MRARTPACVLDGAYACWWVCLGGEIKGPRRVVGLAAGEMEDWCW
jgi:hypothetical protein